MDVHFAFRNGCRVTSPRLWRGCLRISRLQESPLVQVSVERSDLVIPLSVLKATKDDSLVSLKHSRVFIKLRRAVLRVTFTKGCDLVPIVRLQIKTIHLRLVVVLASDCTADQVHVLTSDDRLMV